MYLLYESLYGELLNECDSTNIIGLYDTKEKAINKAIEIIDTTLKDNCYVLDEERKNIKVDNLVRFFYNHQENWNDYFEIIIKKIDLITEEEKEKQTTIYESMIDYDKYYNLIYDYVMNKATEEELKDHFEWYKIENENRNDLVNRMFDSYVGNYSGKELEERINDLFN